MYGRIALCAVLTLAGCECGEGPGNVDGSTSDGGDGGGVGDAGECAAETCNGADDDCDGIVDEQTSAACGTDVGTCVAGVQQCVGGALGDCEGSVEPALVEACDGQDDDCDGMTDEDCPCDDGSTQSCGSDTGECTAGTQTCAGGSWGDCVGEIDATSELCNALDDDCDGTADDGFIVAVSCDGNDSDACEEGTLVCTTDGVSTMCDDTTGDIAEDCDGDDDDCDGGIDEGCDCDPGDTQPCGTDEGECSAGAQTCSSGGTWGTCAGGVSPRTESCNLLDDDCDAMTDEDFTLGGDCDGPDTDSCDEGNVVCDLATGSTRCDDATGNSTETCDNTDQDCDGATDEGVAPITCGMGACQVTANCVAGSQTCTPGTPGTETCNNIDDDCDGTPDDNIAPTMCGMGACAATGMCVGGVMQMCMPGTPGTETCNGIDDNCNGTVDDGVPPVMCGMGACAASAQCVGGVQNCVPGTPGTETCNNVDDDCDGMIDEMNPGGGTPCGMIAGTGCVARTVCVSGALVCRGTFVGPASAGLPTGSQTSPWPTIAQAQAEAMAIGGGADVCACDPSTAGATRYPENVTMIEGISVLGNYDCGTWMRPGGRTTEIGNTDHDGVNFPAGITRVTSLEQFTVDALNSNDVASTTGITIASGSAPTIATVNVTMGTVGTPIGIDCQGCGAALNGVTTGGGVGVGLAVGLNGTGDLSGLAVSMGSYGPGTTSMAGSQSFGVRLMSCTGAPTFMGVNTFGGSAPGGGAIGTRTAFDATGAMCAPAITGGNHRGCEVGGAICIGMSCSMASLCTITNVGGTGGAGRTGIIGSTGQVPIAYGLRCLSGGCMSVTGSFIYAGPIANMGRLGIGMEIDAASPLVDDNQITGPDGIGASGGQYDSLFLRLTRSTITNNVILAGTIGQAASVVRYEMSSFGPALIEPTVHSNTIQYGANTISGARAGLTLLSTPGGISGPMGVFRNNIIEHSGFGGTTRPVVEADANADPRLFENNDLWDPTVLMGQVYINEGMTPINIMTLNTQPGATANIDTDCAPNATWHIASGTPCVNAGTDMGAPATDFDGQRRPNPAGGRYDIGADEFVP